MLQIFEMNVNILVGITGSVAAIKAKPLVCSLKCLRFDSLPNLRIEVKVVTTENALHFFSIEDINNLATVLRDDNEWATWKQISDPVLHIELRRWADMMVIAPLDANTLAKIANGICDNLLTCVARAWDDKKPLLFCPAMNTFMWNHPVTAEQIKKMQSFGYIEIPCIEKTLACGDVGYGAMAEVATIVQEVSAHIEQICNRTLIKDV